MRENLKVRRVNATQLSRDMRLSREVYEALRKMDSGYKAYRDFGLYPENEENINEENYLDKRVEQIEKAKERLLNYYRDNLRRIVNTLKIEILFELANIDEEGGNFDLFEMGYWDDLEGV